jgi:uncharacterized protein YndB with AHSA1/START domain
MQITVSTVVYAPIKEVWSAYTTPDDIKLWNAASSDWHTTSSIVDLRPGGKFCSRMEAKDGSFGFDFEGEYTKVVPHQLIEYQFGGRVPRWPLQIPPPVATQIPPGRTGEVLDRTGFRGGLLA